MLLARLPRTSFTSPSSHSSVKLPVISMWCCGVCQWHPLQGRSLCPSWRSTMDSGEFTAGPHGTSCQNPHHWATAAPPTLSRDFCCLSIGGDGEKPTMQCRATALQEELLPLQMNTELPIKDEHKPTGSLSTDCWSAVLLLQGLISHPWRVCRAQHGLNKQETTAFGQMKEH